MVNYARAGRSQRKLWWRTAAVLTCKSPRKQGYRAVLSRSDSVVFKIYFETAPFSRRGWEGMCYISTHGLHAPIFYPLWGEADIQYVNLFWPKKREYVKRKLKKKNGCLNISFFYLLQPVFGQVRMDQPEYCFSTFLGVPRKLFSSKLNFQGSCFPGKLQGVPKKMVI